MSLIERVWGHRGWRSACFTMLKAGSACQSLCWGQRVQKEGDWEKGGVLEQQAGFSPLGVPAKAANKGAQGGLSKGDIGRLLCGVPPGKATHWDHMERRVND